MMPPELEETQPIARTVFGDADPLEQTHDIPAWRPEGVYQRRGAALYGRPDLSEGVK